jgi:hypothetical protein
MVTRSIAGAMVAVCWIGAQSPAQAGPRAVVELFTSQGCSSCPPADKLLGELANDPSIVAISVPIDYWDYLGWKDTLASPRNTARQKAYARMRGDGQVYTPQVVVNGSLHALGSDKEAIEAAIDASRKHGAMSSPPLTLTMGNGRIEVALAPGGETSAHAGAEVWLCGLSRAVTIAIGRGENTGRTITYHNVARRWVKLGDWNDTTHSWNVPIQTLKGDGIDEVAVLMQSGTVEKPRTMLSAMLGTLR